jgi:hypothetical protein
VPPPDLPATQRRVAGAMAAAALTATLVLAALVLWPPPLPPMPGAADRLLFALRLDMLVLLWLAAGIGHVARLRFVSARDIEAGAAESGPAVSRGNAVLRNTLEQAVLALGAHAMLAIQLPPRWMGLLPGLVGLFCLGRLLFWQGYRHGAARRAFGFALTFYPSVAALLAAVALMARSAFTS